MTVRKPAVAGSFYPSEGPELSKTVDGCYRHPLGPGKGPPAPRGDAKVIAVVSPHAGYEYSGPVAAHSYLHASSLRKPDLIVIVGPNHYGIGSGVSTFKEGSWETPIGSMRVDARAAADLVRRSDIAAFDAESQTMEHSIEVQLPFLQRIYGDAVPFLPISLLFQDRETAKTIGASIAEVVRDRKAILIASSDFTHYEPAASARRKDSALIETALKMDMDPYYDTLEKLQVTACGFGAIATVIEAARTIGLHKGELLKYANSGDTTGDNNSVVGYASIRFV